jgi:hypothetical protein
MHFSTKDWLTIAVPKLTGQNIFLARILRINGCMRVKYSVPVEPLCYRSGNLVDLF